MADKAKKSYEQLQAELNSIIAWFEGDEVDLDSAVIKYEQATKLIKEMEKYLAATENKIKKISADK